MAVSPQPQPLGLIVFFSAISQCRAALFDQRLEFAAHFVACSVLSPLEILLQAVHVIDAGTDLREEVCIACTRPPTGQEVSGNKAECECDKGDYSGYSHLFSLLPAPALCECRYRSLTRPLRNRAILVFARRQASTSMVHGVPPGAACTLARDHRYTNAADQNGSRRRPWRGWKRERPVSNPARGFTENGKSHEKTKYQLDKVRIKRWLPGPDSNQRPTG